MTSLQLIPKVETTDKTVTTTTELVACTSDFISTPRPGMTITLIATINLTVGTGTTSVSVKCRRGTTTAGTQVDETVTFNISAGNTDDLACSFQDTPGDVASQQYVVTVTQTGATGNGTVVHASLHALVPA